MMPDEQAAPIVGRRRAAGAVGAAGRAVRALWGAWMCVGSSRGKVPAVPVGDVLWALPWVGLILGLGWTALFAVAWRLFGEYPVGLRLVPVLLVVAADLSVTGRFSMAGVRVIESLAYRDDHLLRPRRDITAVGTIAAVVLVLATYAMLLAIPKGIEWWPADWRHSLHWMYPRPVFRPLLLVPVWACWSMVLAAGMGRARRPETGELGTKQGETAAADAETRGRKDAEKRRVACLERGDGHEDRESALVQQSADGPAGLLAGRATPAQIFVGFLPAAVLTAIYASRDKNLVIGLGVALVVFLCAYVAAMATALRWRGQNGMTILATGLAGRTAFLLCWLFIGRALHGW